MRRAVRRTTASSPNLRAGRLYYRTTTRQPRHVSHLKSGAATPPAHVGGELRDLNRLHPKVTL
jgi:hypothetical protein